MNESTLIYLKVIVERAVRPVRASTPRKRKMREELLAHVTAVFEEEVARLGDERTALERTAQRFGNPAELTGQLQQSVPAIDAFEWFVDWVWFRPGESTLRRALRYASLIGLLTGAVVLAALVGSAPPAEWTKGLLLYCGSIPLSFFSIVFAFYFLEDWMRQALFGPAGRSWPKAALSAVACFAFYYPCIVMPGLLQQEARDPWSLVPIAVWSAAWMVYMQVSLARMAADRMRYLREWASLMID